LIIEKSSVYDAPSLNGNVKRQRSIKPMQADHQINSIVEALDEAKQEQRHTVKIKCLFTDYQLPDAPQWYDHIFYPFSEKYNFARYRRNYSFTVETTTPEFLLQGASAIDVPETIFGRKPTSDRASEEASPTDRMAIFKVSKWTVAVDAGGKSQLLSSFARGEVISS